LTREIPNRSSPGVLYLYMRLQGRSHRSGWSGFNPTTFRGNNHISANIHKFGGTLSGPVGSHVATAHRARDRWLQIVWKWHFLVFKARMCHENPSW